MNNVHWTSESERSGIAKPVMKDCLIIGGRSHPELVEKICRTLDIEPITLDAKNFSNGETSIAIKESVRDKDVFVIQSSHGPVNDHLMELLIVLSALKIASAKSVTTVLPIFPYSRQLDASAAAQKAINPPQTIKAILAPQRPSTSTTFTSTSSPSLAPMHPPLPAELGSPRKAATFGEETRQRTSSSQSDRRGSSTSNVGLGSQTNYRQHNCSKGGVRDLPQASGLVNLDHNTGLRSWVAQSGSLVASLLATAGADHVITMDLHDPQYQGFFDVPFDNLLFRPLLIEYIQSAIPTYHSAVIVSPDAGGAKRATQIADHLHMRFALIHQDRRNNATILVGDVNDRVAILIDDLVDSGKTLIRAARILKDHGAIQVVAICTHGLFTGDTVNKIRDSAIDRVVTTNSVPQEKNQAVLGDRLQVVDVSLLFAEAIRRVFNGESISRLYHQVPLSA